MFNSQKCFFVTQITSVASENWKLLFWNGCYFVVMLGVDHSSLPPGKQETMSWRQFVIIFKLEWSKLYVNYLWRTVLCTSKVGFMDETFCYERSQYKIWQFCFSTEDSLCIRTAIRVSSGRGLARWNTTIVHKSTKQWRKSSREGVGQIRNGIGKKAMF